MGFAKKVNIKYLVCVFNVGVILCYLLFKKNAEIQRSVYRNVNKIETDDNIISGSEHGIVSADDLMNNVHVPNIAKDNLFKSDTYLDRVIALMRNTSINRSKYGGKRFCNGNVEIFNGDYLYLKDVVLKVDKQRGARKGGEMLLDTLRQSDQTEKVHPLPGFFTVQCDTIPKNPRQPRGIPSDYKYIEFVNSVDKYKSDQKIEKIQNFTFLIRRTQHFSQLYFTMQELFLAYVSARLYHQNPKSSTLIFIDAHPIARLDYLWKHMFGTVLRVRRLQNPLFLSNLVSIQETTLPFHQALRNQPFVSDFKEHMYRVNGIDERDRTICPNNLNAINITLIRRRNFLSNPRYSSGKIYRKIKNEDQLTEYLRLRLQRSQFSAVQLDELKIEDQVRVIAYTNIFIGIHGAGLSYTMLLRAGSSLIEFYPSNNHFEQIAHWAKVHYVSHGGPRPFDEYIHIEPEMAMNFINDAMNRIFKNCDVKTEE